LPKHLDVARVVLESQVELKAKLAKLPDGTALESLSGGVIASISQNQQIPPQVVLVEPSCSGIGQASRTTGKHDNRRILSNQGQKLGVIVKQRVFDTCIKEFLPTLTLG
jgi:hypothetical protein